MQLALNLSYSGTGISIDIAKIQEAERLGYASVWTAEAYGSDAVAPAAWIAARTETIHVGTGIMQIPARTPAMTAMTAMTLDGDGGRVAVERALSAANAAALVERLPQGLATPLVERAANLSHGERQLLAIARALVYNPAILVLDEATSSVDPESERMIRDAMARLMAGRTTITIAHRLSTIHDADRILVLHRGRIHEEGTHAALLKRGGLYARLHELGAGAALG